MDIPETNSEVLLVPPAFPGARLVPLGEFNRSPVIRIGRALSLVGSGLEAQIKLRSRSVSKRHALLLNADGRMIVHDLGSRAGVVVNERMVRQAIIGDGDRVQFGSIKLRLDRGRPSGGRRPVSAATAGVRDESGTLRPIESPLFLIGRQDVCDMVLHDEEVARVHAVIYQADGQHILRHLPARSITLVNGQQWWEVVLQHGDLIEIAGTRIRFEFAGQSLNDIHEATRSGNRESEDLGSSVGEIVDVDMGSGIEPSPVETDETTDPEPETGVVTAPPRQREIESPPPVAAAVVTPQSTTATPRPTPESDSHAIVLAAPQATTLGPHPDAGNPASIAEPRASIEKRPNNPPGVVSPQPEPVPQWVFDCGPIVLSLARPGGIAQPLASSTSATPKKPGRRPWNRLLVAIALVVIASGAAAVAWWRLAGA